MIEQSSSKAPYDAREVANFVLDLADEEAVGLTQLSLLKIVYFAHGWYLAERNRPLITQPVEAWKYGPVVKVVKDAFKDFQKREINERARKLVLKTGELQIVVPHLSREDSEFVTGIFHTYKKYNGWTLSDMTHEKNSPWDKVWNASQVIGRLGLRIKNEDIRAHFLSISGRVELQ